MIQREAVISKELALVSARVLENGLNNGVIGFMECLVLLCQKY